MKLNCYIQKHKRRLFQCNCDKDEAIKFLKTVEFATVYDSEDHQLLLEELENAENVRPDTGTGQDNTVASGREIPEDPYSELFKPIGGNTE